MSPVTHALITWGLANSVALNRRDRGLVLLAGVLPDLDGLTVLVGREAYQTYHHVVCHHGLGALIAAGLITLVASRRWRTGLLALLAFQVHLACDYLGSAGVNTDGSLSRWVLPYLWPFVGSGTPRDFDGPTWYWNPHMWPLVSWQNILVTVVFLILALWIAIRLGRTPVEALTPRTDARVVATLRQRFAGNPEAGSNPSQGILIAQIVTTAALATVAALTLRGFLAAS